MRTLTSSDLIMIDIRIYYKAKSKSMGPCISNKTQQQVDNSNTSQQQKYAKHVLLENRTRPQISSLYNLLRKSSQIQIFHNSTGSQKLFSKQNHPNLNALSNSDLKMLYSFKNLLFIGKYEEAIIRIRQAANPKSVNIMTQQQAKMFIRQFPIFDAGHKIYQPKQIPILAINSSQLNSDKNVMIFLHSASHQNQEVYQKLNINQIIKDDSTSSLQGLITSLKNSKGPKILILHSPNRSQDDLLAVLSEYSVSNFGVTSLDAKIYSRKCLPQTSLNENVAIQQQKVRSSQRIKTNSDQNIALTDVYQKYLQLLFGEIGGDETASTKVDRAYNLLITLISNIYNNKGADSYRKVKKTNKQVNELLGRYKNGVKLLSQVGFKEDGAFYSNETDVKYLKIYRTDLDIAYKNYCNSN